VSPKKGDLVPPPAIGAEWQIVFANNEAAKGWQELANQAPSNLRKAWDTMRNDPGPGPGKPTSRHHQLRGPLATVVHRGHTMPRWQIEVTSGGRIWYVVDEQKRTVWVVYAGPGHPKATE
jgi:hypothetical protein